MNLQEITFYCKKEDVHAQKRLYIFSYKLLYAIAHRYVRDETLAKDVLQETYIKIFKNISKIVYIDDRSTLAWMKRICVNEALQLIRKNKTWNNNQVNINNSTVGNEHNLFSDDIYALLLKLPEQQRIVFNLFAIEGYSHKEIAKQIGIQENNSRTIVGRARKFLASHITKEMIHESA